MNKLQAHNEAVIDAPVDQIWSIITDINMLPKVNPGIVSATGAMDQLNATRSCQIKNRGKIGNVTERLIEFEPGRKTTWTIVTDDMGMGKMLKNARFCFVLQKVSEGKTKVINETWYEPANLMARILSTLMMKKMIMKTQEKILDNIKMLTSNK